MEPDHLYIFLIENSCLYLGRPLQEFSKNVRQKLPDQCPQQSGFAPKKPTVDRILALRVLTERLRVLMDVNVDLHMVYDSVNRNVHWRNLAPYGPHLNLLNVISEPVYVQSAVSCAGTIFDNFPVITGVGQGRVLVLTYNTYVNHVLDRIEKLAY